VSLCDYYLSYLMIIWNDDLIDYLVTILLSFVLIIK